MIWLIIAALVFVAVLFWMLIETRGTWHLLWVIPTCIGLLTGTYAWYSSVLGYPTDQYEKGQKFVLLSYFVPQEENKLVVWVVLENEQVPKAVIIPYDPDEEKELEQIAKTMASGGKFMGEFSMPPQDGREGSKKDGSESFGSGSNKSQGGMLSFTKLSVDDFLPKKGYVDEEESMEMP